MVQDQLKESQALIADLKKISDESSKESSAKDSKIQELQGQLDDLQRQFQAVQTENESLKVSKGQAMKTVESKQQARTAQRISELEAELEAANKRAADVLEEGKGLAKKQLEIETKDRALKAKLRERGEELEKTKKQLSDVSFRLEKTTETVKRLQDELASATSSQSSNGKRLDELQRQYDNLKQLHEEREKLYSSLKQESQESATSLEQVTAECAKAKEELEHIQAEQEVNVAHMKQMEELVAQSTEAYNRLQQEMNSREHELETSVEKLQEERRMLTDRLSRQEQEVSEHTINLVKELEKERRKKAELMQTVAELQSEVKILRATNTTIASNHSQVETVVESKLMESEKRVTALESENSSLRLKVAEKEKDLMEFKIQEETRQQEEEAKESEWKKELQDLRLELDKQREASRHREVSQSNEVRLAQNQFELINSKYEETVKLVALLRKQLQEQSSISQPSEPSTHKSESVTEENLPLFPTPVGPKVNPSTTRLKELEQQLRAKEGRLTAAEAALERLRRDAERSASELLDLKRENDELTKQTAKMESLREEYKNFVLKYNKMVEEYSAMSSDLMDIRDERVEDEGESNV